MKEAQRPTIADLWKNFDLAEAADATGTPVVTFNNVHGSVLSIVTNQPIQLADLWAQACKPGQGKQG